MTTFIPHDDVVKLAKEALRQLATDADIPCRQKIDELEEIRRGIDADILVLSVQAPMDPATL
jgi:hypothetical protein